MQKERQPAYPLLGSIVGFHYCDLLLDEGRDAEVLARATGALEQAVAERTLINVALGHLYLGRAQLLAAQRRAVGDLAQVVDHLKQAVDGLRRAGVQEYLPLGLLARADLHTHTRAFADARRDLDETLTLSTRCGFRLHKIDAHLAYARLHLAEGNPAAARPHLDKARALIAATGYHRRDDELARLDAAAT